VGTDSHTTMVNGLGVFGWGVGGIEAEAAMLGQPLSMLIPDVVGFKLHGRLPEGATATDLVLTSREMLRKKGVVGKFVEFYGTGLSSLTLPDRATIANMAPEYGATMGFFPSTRRRWQLSALHRPQRGARALVEAYTKEQGIFRTDETPDPIFTDKLELDLATVEPTMAGPKRPQDRVPLRQSKARSKNRWKARAKARRRCKTTATIRARERLGGDRGDHELHEHFESIADAGRGLLAKKAVERGLHSKPWVKTSLAPGSKVVTDYLEKAAGWPYLESSCGFQLVGYGCTTCIGNSGPLPKPSARPSRTTISSPFRCSAATAISKGASSPGARELSGVAAAGGRLRARGPHGFRHRQRAARQ
jgi:aconitate hydratase